jgi:hypothetical protein
VTCGSRYSSAWGALERKNGRVPFPQRRVLVDNTGMRFDQNTFQNDQFFSIDYKKAKFINFPHKLTVIGKSEIKKFVSYVVDKYGKNFINLQIKDDESWTQVFPTCLQGWW